MRGEHQHHAPHRFAVSGSSPHARGARDGILREIREGGLIPACAGSTAATTSVGWGAAGSSPHARGAPRDVAALSKQRGLIPACAGSTPRSGSRRRSRWAHPRMRGEHSAGDQNMRCSRGSSPHARGAPVFTWFYNTVIGLIPACAGSTRPVWGGASERPAHPRMRGEHRCFCRGAGDGRGSSPHARGALCSPPRCRRAVGLIPACAGSTGTAAIACPPCPAHPRMRGEHSILGGGVEVQGGSSPHARGAPAPRTPTCRGDGLIPACAGSTLPTL